MECTKINCPIQAGTKTDNCGENCPWKTTAKIGDLISRAAALEALGECPYNWNDWPEEIQAVNDWESHKEAIENIPALDAVPVVHGRWIDEKPNDSLDPRMRCSVCTGVESPLIKWLYCPNCGAKMDANRGMKNDRIM